MAYTGRTCLDFDPIWTRLVVLTLLSTVVLTVSPAYAHTSAELDMWSIRWEHQAMREGFTDELLAEYEDYATRHPRYFGRLIPTPTHTHPRTPQPSTMGTSVEQWRPLVEAHFRAADVDRAMRIMRCESGGNPDAKNPRSSASGLFQHLGKYWPTRSAAAGYDGVSIFDPTANVAVAAWLRDQAGGWGHWVCR